MAAMTQLAFEPVHRLCDRMTRGEISLVDIVESYLERIARYDDKLHAFIDVYADDARMAAKAAADAIASDHRVGPLHGIPVAVKDIVEIQGRVTGGCGAWRDRRSTTPATLVEKMMASGMIVLGKTHTVQFAMGGWGANQQFGTPWNLWDLEVHRTPGGSSSWFWSRSRGGPVPLGNRNGHWRFGAPALGMVWVGWA